MGCEASGCRGGCLVDGECNYDISQVNCSLQRKPWCQACPISVFNYCFPWADCYAVCSGCCGTASGDCPEAPYKLREDGPCAPCANRPKMCEACFPESICSAEYNATLYHNVVTQHMASYVNPWTTTSSKPSEVNTTTAVVPESTTSSVAVT